jgi:hypothetical protein
MAAGQAIYSPLMPQQPCGMVVNAAPAPAGGHDALAVIQESFVCVPAGCNSATAGGSQIDIEPVVAPAATPEASRRCA